MTHTIGRSWRQVVSCGCAGRIVAQERIRSVKHILKAKPGRLSLTVLWGRIARGSTLTAMNVQETPETAGDFSAKWKC